MIPSAIIIITASAIIIITASALYSVDVFFLNNRAATAIGPEVQNFIIDNLPNLRESIIVGVTNNHLGVALVSNDHLTPLLLNAHP